MPTRRYLLFLLIVTALLGGAVALGIHITSPMPGYELDMFEWVRSGRIADTFTPQAYPLFTGAAYRIAHMAGVVGAQWLLQIGMAAVSYGILRQLGLPERWSAFGALPVALFPETLLSIPKLWDVGLSTLLLLLLVWIFLRTGHRSRPQSLWLWCLLGGAVFGAGCFSRPNYLLLFPVLLVAVFRSGHREPAAARWTASALFLVVMAAAFALLGAASHGAPFFPQNGPYNLYAGQNPQAIPALLRTLNAEQSLGWDFAATHPGAPVPDFHRPEARKGFTVRSVHFALSHPGTEAELVAVKLFTLFRPDTKLHPLLSPMGLVKALLALPVLLLLVLSFAPGRAALTRDDRLLLLVEALYVVPFLITNSDPRFRFPLDTLLLLHSVSLLYRRTAARADRSAAWKHQTV